MPGTSSTGSSSEARLRSLLQHGWARLNAGDLKGAGRACQEVLAIKPDLVQGHFLVGLVALEAKERQTAFQAFGSVTKLDPAHTAAWAQLAKLFMSEGQVSRADAALSEAAKYDPADPLVQDLLGTVYSLMGDYGLARQWYERACKARPDYTPFLLNLANNHVYYGETAPALSLFDRIVSIQPDSPQAHWALAGARKAADDTHLKQCQSLVSRQGLHPRMQAFYYYAIGKECEDLSRWEEAFVAFSKGAAARRKTVEYDEAVEEEMFQFLETHFDEHWLEARDTAMTDTGNPGVSPIFVLGQPRTGTTLIERIISSHSMVTSAGELQQFSLAIRRLSDYRDPRRFTADLFQAALAIDPVKLGNVYLETTRRMQGDTPRFVDKLPQNYLCIPLILKALPDAKIIHLTRDPMDACFASYKQLFADAYLHSYDQLEMARHHGRYHRLMQVWRDRFPGRFLDVSYEETAQDLEPNVRRLLDFLELPFEPQCLSFHDQSSAVSTASAVQVREPAHTRSIGRWRQYEVELEPMRQELERMGVPTST